MNERQMTVCAIALWCDRFDHDQVAQALSIENQRARELIDRGAREQGQGTMGQMRNCPYGKDRVVSARDDDGNVTRSVMKK